MSKRAAIQAILTFVLILFIISPLLVGQAELQQQGRVIYNVKDNMATVGSNGYVFSFVGRGETPFYRFSDPTNQTYFVKFMKLIEFNDEDGDGKFDPNEANPERKYSLPSTDWILTVNETDQTFTFSTPNDSADTPSISFVNHYAADQPERLKFDIRIANWAWQDTSKQDSSNMLALRFDVLSETDEDSSGHALENGVEFDDIAYFEAVNIAKVDGIDAPVGISIEENSVFLAFSHFISLEHDPIIGFRVPVMVPGVIGDITTIDYIYTALVATALLVTVVFSRRR